ncbi:hypothetical protein [Hymenobacter coccineus]|uniref:Uncharacterized protein n=1 Tax=Hymenobacter coccineus TaxID=1908235 RepID=A0A1G1TJF3_9BACT|nr:hypothetical protein [Hymenobacter coccineus]OGX90993.1 hypothetical protein BEN49_05805 [Hymenobacter coccineus]
MYNLRFAEFLRVWLHRAHARVVDDEARVLDLLEQVLAEAGQLVGAHPGAPFLPVRCPASLGAAGGRWDPARALGA